MRSRLLIAALVAAEISCGGPGSARHRQKASELEPARLVPTATEGGAVATARVRVYADADYRGQNPGYKASARRLVAQASRVLEPTIGVRLEVADVRAWERPPGEGLEMALVELEKLDPAEDVDWVIGLIGSLSSVAVEVHQLGYARVLGRHLVLRGLNDVAEVSLLEEAIGSIERSARQELYARRKRHKELVLLLHELGHTLGAMHVADPARLMYPTYEGSQASFAAENAALMRVAASARFGARGDRTAEWKAVLAHIRGSSFSGWNEDEKASLLAELEARVEAEEQGTAGLPLGASVRPADRDRFRAAERLHAAGRALDAWEELEPLLEFYPAEPSVQVLGCRLAVAARRDAAAIAARCAKAAAAAPDDPEPPLRLAQSHLAAGERDKAIGAARRAEELAARLETGAVPVWKELAAFYKELGAVSWTERAASAAGGLDEAQKWARLTRARYGLRPGGPIEPAREAAYVEAVRELLTLVYERKFADAVRRAAALRRRFGDAAGIDAALCDLEIRRRRYGPARARCRRALSRYPDSSWAHYLTGLLDEHDGKRDAALEHLERAIALDPELQHAYQVAAELYRAAGRKSDEARVRDAYQKQFGRPLP